MIPPEATPSTDAITEATTKKAPVKNAPLFIRFKNSTENSTMEHTQCVVTWVAKNTFQKGAWEL